ARPTLPHRDPAAAGWRGGFGRSRPFLSLRRHGAALRRGRRAQGAAVALRRLRGGVPAHPDPQLRRAGPLARGRPSPAPFIFIPSFAAKLYLAIFRNAPTAMNRLHRWLFVLLVSLFPVAAFAQQGLEIDIIGGNASALP